jgi:hypothetical protein
MTNNIIVIILGFTLVFTTLINLPSESYGDRRHLSQDTYTAIGKLLTCDDVNADSVNSENILDRLGCSNASDSMTNDTNNSSGGLSDRSNAIAVDTKPSPSSTKDNNGTVIEPTDRSVVIGGIPKELEVNQFSVSSMKAVGMFVTKLEYL